MVLGQDAALPRDLNDDFRASGLSHLVAASGANIALLATLALGLAALLGIPIRTRLFLVIGLIALYVPLAGGGPSIQRAGIMGAAAIVALLASRPSDRWYALVLAASGTLLLDPRSVSDPGWQMSFAAVLALLALARPLVERTPLPRPLAEATAVTVLATIATAPIAAAHFGTASLASLPANVLAAPVVAPIMWLGFIAAAVGQVSPALAAPLVSLAAPLLGYLTALASAAAHWPGAGIKVDPLLVALVCAAALGAILWWLRTPDRQVTPPARRRVVVLATLAVATLLVAARPVQAPAPPPPGTLRVTALDVGQGDSILVQGGGASVLFDAGVPEAPTLKRLKEQGIKRLDAFVITHVDNDHAGGAPAVLSHIPVGLLLDGRANAPLPEPGQEVALGGLRLRMLWPTDEARASGAPTNDRCIVIEASVGRRRALLGGDAESDVLDQLDLRDVDILKVSHHGSNDDLLPEVLQKITPEVALISVGRNNDYGHPTANTLRMLRGIEVHRTDLEGTVSAEASPSGISVRRSH
jgi:competence protein ComEC